MPRPSRSPWRPSVADDPLATDYHCHLIPGIDDGSRDAAESVAMARGLAELGVRALYVTPHQYRFGNELDRAALGEHIDRLRALLAEAGTPLDLRASAEHLFSDRLLDALLQGEDLLTFDDGDGGVPRLLVELPLRAPAVGVERVAELLAGRGIQAVMAHPERVHSVIARPELLSRWSAAGWTYQLDVLALDGTYGRAEERTARLLLQQGRYAFIGSDLHRPRQLERLRAARAVYRSMAPEGPQA